MNGGLSVEELLVLLVTAILVVWPMGRICRRAGFQPWLGVLILLPGLNIVLLYFLALAPWRRQEAQEEVR